MDTMLIPISPFWTPVFQTNSAVNFTSVDLHYINIIYKVYILCNIYVDNQKY